MAKIKELLAGREKLAKYDELTEWKKRFECDNVLIPHEYNEEIARYVCSLTPILIPDHIKQIIVSALDAEIKKPE